MNNNMLPQAEVLALLNDTLSMAKRSQLYSKKLASVGAISDLSGLSGLPFTTKEELREGAPFANLAVPMEEVIETHMSSGTTGKATGSFYTKADLDAGSEAISRAWANFGITRESRVMFAMGYGLFSGAALNTLAIQKLGAFVLPAGIQPVAKQIDLIRDYGIDTLVATPGFFLHLHSALVERGIDPSRLTLRRGIAAGEVYSESVRAEIESKLGIRICDHYGLCEVNTGIAYETPARDGFDYLDGYVLAEVVDVATGEPVSVGERGELVLTSLRKEASPIIRYRTGDLCVLLEKDGHRVRTSRIVARKDDLMFVKGVKVNPHELRGQLLERFPGRLYGEVVFQVKKNVIDYVPKIVCSAAGAQEQIGADRVKNYVRETTGLNFDIEFVPKEFFGRESNNKVKIVQYIE